MAKKVAAALLAALLVLSPLGVLAGAGMMGLASPDGAACVPGGGGAGIVLPLPEGSFAYTSPFGWRTHPITKRQSLHTGLDLAAPAGTPIVSIAAGTVSFAGPAGGYGNLILIDHEIGAKRVTSGYAHMYSDGVLVAKGQKVEAGSQIGTVGSSGRSTGPHLHFEIRPDGGAAIDPAPWLAANGSVAIGKDEIGTCASGPLPGAPPEFQGDPEARHDDPSGTGGFVTAAMLHFYKHAKATFPETSWGCWSPRAGQKSDHPLGKACDVTFGNTYGQFPAKEHVEAGWTMVNWAKQHASALRIRYIIWQGKIWSLERAKEGWRAYNGGGMHNPSDATGGHYDHAHFSQR